MNFTFIHVALFTAWVLMIDAMHLWLFTKYNTQQNKPFKTTS